MILSNGYFECAAPGQDARVHNVDAHLSHQSSLKLDYALLEWAEGVGLLFVMPVGYIYLGEKAGISSNFFWLYVC